MDREAELEAIQKYVGEGRHTTHASRPNPEYEAWVRRQERKRVSNRTYSKFQTGKGAPPDPYQSKSRRTG